MADDSLIYSNDCSVWIPATVWQNIATEYHLGYGDVYHLSCVNQFLHEELTPILQSEEMTQFHEGLPPTLWSRIVSDYLSFQDVENLMDTNCFFRFGIPRWIQRLNVFHPRELDYHNAMKFPNCSQLFIYCFTRTTIEEDLNLKQNLSRETIEKTVPFLRCLPNLSFVHFEGYYDIPKFIYLFQHQRDNIVRTNRSYDARFCSRPEHDRKLFQDFVEQLADVFIDKASKKDGAGEKNGEFLVSGIVDPRLDVLQKYYGDNAPVLWLKVCRSFLFLTIWNWQTSYFICRRQQSHHYNNRHKRFGRLFFYASILFLFLLSRLNLMLQKYYGDSAPVLWLKVCRSFLFLTIWNWQTSYSICRRQQSHLYNNHHKRFGRLFFYASILFLFLLSRLNLIEQGNSK